MDRGREYEVSLNNILFPRYFCCIKEGDPNSAISFYGRLQKSEFNSYEYNMYTYLPERNIASIFDGKNIASITKAITTQIARELKTILNESFDVYFPYSEIIYYDEDLERLVVSNVIVPPNSNNIYTDIIIRFASHLVRILGFSLECFYQRPGVESGDTLLASTTSHSIPVKNFALDIQRADA